MDRYTNIHYITRDLGDVGNGYKFGGNGEVVLEKDDENPVDSQNNK